MLADALELSSVVSSSDKERLEAEIVEFEKEIVKIKRGNNEGGNIM